MNNALKIVSWNCNGALRKKTHIIDELSADILIVQECENPKLSSADYRSWAKNYIWTGQNKNKGIGIFAKPELVINQLNWQGTHRLNIPSSSTSVSWETKDLELFLPFQVGDTIIIGVWTKGKNLEPFDYIGQLWKFLQIHKSEIENKKAIIIGDLNSNTIWDKPWRWWNHSDVVKELEEINILSAYHYHHEEAQGEETQPTFFLQRKEDKPYHIDYAFCTREILKNSKILIGKNEQWLKHSDHMPLILEISSASKAL